MLELIALSGELSTQSLSRLDGGVAYIKKIVIKLKKQGLLKTYYKDGLRGLRLTSAAKQLLLADNEKRFAFYFTENADTNHVRTAQSRRQRLHRIADATLTMKNAGVSVFRDEHDNIFSPAFEGSVYIHAPVFYNSREIKELGTLFTKVKGARSIGTLLTEQNIFVAYNLGNSLMKWEYKAEMRVKALMENMLCFPKITQQYSFGSIKGLLFGDNVELAYRILTNEQEQYYIKDEDYDSFYFVTNDEKGETLLRLLCNTELSDKLHSILTEPFYQQSRGCLIENDAMTEDGIPVLLAYNCDLQRIRRFASALKSQNRRGILFCLDYQADVLKRYCGDVADIKTIDYEKMKRRIFD